MIFFGIKMATYLVGDLHGCYDELRLVLDKAEFNPEYDELWCTGDLIARGDNSLACLRFIKSLGNKATTVLGNHDLHLLATAKGIKRINPKDKLNTIFEAPDCHELLEWLRHQPLLAQHSIYNFIMVHAGISPDWDLNTSLKCAKEAESALQQENYVNLLSQMYSDTPDKWSETLTGVDRWRYIINVFTRMRFCYADHRLDFTCKAPVNEAPSELRPWFELDNPLYSQQHIIFGHWASLIGYPTPSTIYALDSGCVWGNYLTLLRWDDKKTFTQTKLK